VVRTRVAAVIDALHAPRVRVVQSLELWRLVDPDADGAQLQLHSRRTFEGPSCALRAVCMVCTAPAAAAAGGASQVAPGTGLWLIATADRALQLLTLGTLETIEQTAALATPDEVAAPGEHTEELPGVSSLAISRTPTSSGGGRLAPAGGVRLAVGFDDGSVGLFAVSDVFGASWDGMGLAGWRSK